MISNRKMYALAPGYSSEVDTVDEQGWHQALDEFDDANIYQTWSYAAVTSGKRNMSHLTLRKDGRVAAIAQIRIAQVPVLGIGIAYVLWGPLWRRNGDEYKEEVFRQAIRALRNEYVGKRKLTLRLFPLLFDFDSLSFSTLLKEEGFSFTGPHSRSRTILMNLTSPLEDLREGMKPHWKRELKAAERSGLEVMDGSDEAQFETFIDIYQEMVSRKRFVEPNDINKFRLIQKQLPEHLKMKLLLCRSGEKVCAGVICSAIGKTALYLFGATSNAGMKSRGSYFLQWKLIEQLRRKGITRVYDLNGINPAKNPGTYKFKSDLAGINSTDIYFMGRYDSRGTLLGHLCVRFGELVKSKFRSFREFAKNAYTPKPQANSTQ